MNHRELHDFAARIVHETPNALLLDDGEHPNFWIPRSIVEDNADGTFTAPIWWLLDKGLI